MSDEPVPNDAADRTADRPEADLPQPDHPRNDGPRPDLPPAAQRALAEAEARRAVAAGTIRPAEVGGRGGPEPVRYGDWEKDGLAVDF